MEVHLGVELFTEKSPSLLSWQNQTAYHKSVNRWAFQFRNCLPNQSSVTSVFWSIEQCLLPFNGESAQNSLWQLILLIFAAFLTQQKANDSLQ